MAYQSVRCFLFEHCYIPPSHPQPIERLVQIVAIANDITFNSGAFGPREDAAFRAATEYALAEKLPLVYLAANSGARVGLANEVKQCLQASPCNTSFDDFGIKPDRFKLLGPVNY